MINGASKLRSIADEIEADPTHWTQECDARSSRGIMVDPDSKSAACWCVSGFMVRDGISTASPEGEAIAKACKEISGMDEFVAYNDRPERKPEDIVALFRRAARILEEGGV